MDVDQLQTVQPTKLACEISAQVHVTKAELVARILCVLPQTMWLFAIAPVVIEAIRMSSAKKFHLNVDRIRIVAWNASV